MPIPIDWSPQLPIFASEPFLKAVGDEYGWLGGVDYSGTLRCILPYIIVKKTLLRMVRFRVQTIAVSDGFSVEEEKLFLKSAMDYFRSIGADVVIPATTNAIFRTYPPGADAAPYGSYIIDLSAPEDKLWRNIGRIYRQNISSAQRDGVSIQSGLNYLEPAYERIRDTFKRSKMPFMSLKSFERFLIGLGENGKLMIAHYQGVLQSCVAYAFSTHCAYAVYAGNVSDQHQGANKLIYWEAIRLFKQLGVARFDFVGARINPAKGSKQEAINLFKKRFGTTLIQGYIWKYPLRPIKSKVYSCAVRLLRGGDIVDHERDKLEGNDKTGPDSRHPCNTT